MTSIILLMQVLSPQIFGTHSCTAPFILGTCGASQMKNAIRSTIIKVSDENVSIENLLMTLAESNSTDIETESLAACGNQST
jgi:hypothetical protein